MWPLKLSTWEKVKADVFDSTINDDDNTVVKLSPSGSDNSTADTPAKRTRLPELPTCLEKSESQSLWQHLRTCRDEDNIIIFSQHNTALVTPTSTRLPSPISLKTSTEPKITRWSSPPYNPNPEPSPIAIMQRRTIPATMDTGYYNTRTPQSQPEHNTYPKSFSTQHDIHIHITTITQPLHDPWKLPLTFFHPRHTQLHLFWMIHQHNGQFLCSSQRSHQ